MSKMSYFKLSSLKYR